MAYTKSYEDDPAIRDEDRLWRRLHPSQMTFDPKLQRHRPSSAAFTRIPVRRHPALTPRCDVYSLSVLLYDALTDGKHPFTSDPTDEEKLVLAVVNGQPIPAATANPALPRVLAATIDRAVAKDPAARHPTAGDLARDLDIFAATCGHPPDASTIRSSFR